MKLIITLLLLISNSVYAGDLFALKIRLGDKLAPPKSIREFKLMQESFADRKYRECLKYGSQADLKLPELKSWILSLKLRCAQELFKVDKKSSNELAKAVNAVWSHPEALALGKQVTALREELIESSLLLIEREANSKRASAWDKVGKLLEIVNWADNKQKARLYRLAGELSLSQQNFVNAKDYFDMSLQNEYSSELRLKSKALATEIENRFAVNKTTLLAEAKKNETPSAQDEIVSEKTEELDATPEELEIFNRMNLAIKNGDLLAAVEDGVKVIHDFPGGKRSSEAAKNVLSIYLGLIAHSEEKYLALKDRVISEMRKVDGQRLYDWAQVMASRERFSDALALSQNSLELIGGQPISTKVLLLSANAAYNDANFKLAREYFEKLTREHSGTRAASEAYFRLGLLSFREEKYAEAANHFERFLQVDTFADFDLSSLYWLWRSRQKLELPKANEAAQTLIDRYPLSYFGLRAKAELSGGKFSFNKNPAKRPEWTFHLTESEKSNWNRFLLLYKAGWSDEAQRELTFLNEPSTAQGRVILAYLLNLSGNLNKATEVLYRAIGQDGTLISPSILEIGFPKLYDKEIKKEVNRYKIPPEIILALMRQESSFRKEVKSPAGAIGLMQLMPVTASEIAGDLRIKTRDISSDLIRPEINIRIGSQYLFRRIKNFDGNLPLALAAYNAGIGNVRNWLASRVDIKDLSKSLSSAPEDEIWIDELPWSETSGYVKSVLRNYLVYKTLDQGEYNLVKPVWKF